MPALMMDAIMIANTIGGQCFSYAQIAAWLSETGFEHVEVMRGNPIAEAFLASKGR